jgi:Asp/Glu/hydantoin racemase
MPEEPRESSHVNRSGASVAGLGVGILHVESRFPLVPGHLQHARSLGIPVLYECVAGVTPAQIIAAEPAIEAPIVEAAQRLEERGARAIVGACGSFVNFHSPLVEAVDIPVFSSILTAVPLLLHSLASSAKVALVFASAGSFTERARQQAGIVDATRLVVIGCETLPAFQPILRNEDRLDSAALRQQLAGRIEAMLQQEPDVAIILLQCSEFAPYAPYLRERFDRPVFDVNTMTAWVDRALRSDA